MTRPTTIVIRDERDRQFALKAIYKAPLGMQMRISKPERTVEQNKLLHALCGDLAAQLVWPPPPRNDGEIHDTEWWKRRCTLGWIKDLKDEMKAHFDVEVIVDLEGEDFGILLPHTSSLSTEQFASLCEWIMGFGGMHGVKWTEPDKRPEPPIEAYEGY